MNNGATTYSKVKIVAAGRSDGAARQNLNFLVDIAGDGNSAVLSDTKMLIDGLTGHVGVGMGSSSPAAKLHVMSGDLFVTANSTSADSGQGLYFQSTTNGWNTPAAHAAIFGKRADASNGYLRFDTRQAGTTQEAMQLNQLGRLGIGHIGSSPIAALSVKGTSVNIAPHLLHVYRPNGLTHTGEPHSSILLQNQEVSSGYQYDGMAMMALNQTHLRFQVGNNSSWGGSGACLLYTSPSPRDGLLSRMPSSA